MNKNILYDSEPESDGEEEIKQEQNNPLPQNETVKPPKPQTKTKVVKHKIQEQWDKFVNDDIEKQQIKQLKQQKEPEKLYKCEYCSKGFAKNYYLNRHIQEGRCSVKRDIDLRRERELKELELNLSLKLQKQEERKKKKAIKDAEVVEQNKPVKLEKPPRKPRAQPQKATYTEPIVVQPNPVRQLPKYVFNF